MRRGEEDENGFAESEAKGLLLGEGVGEGSCSVTVSVGTGTPPFLETWKGSNSDTSAACSHSVVTDRGEYREEVCCDR